MANLENTPWEDDVRPQQSIVDNTERHPPAIVHHIGQMDTLHSLSNVMELVGLRRTPTIAPIMGPKITFGNGEKDDLCPYNYNLGMPRKKHFYAVTTGLHTGIYDTPQEANRLVTSIPHNKSQKN